MPSTARSGAIGIHGAGIGGRLHVPAVHRGLEGLTPLPPAHRVGRVRRKGPRRGVGIAGQRLEQLRQASSGTRGAAQRRPRGPAASARRAGSPVPRRRPPPTRPIAYTPPRWATSSATFHSGQVGTGAVEMALCGVGESRPLGGHDGCVRQGVHGPSLPGRGVSLRPGGCRAAAGAAGCAEAALAVEIAAGGAGSWPPRRQCPVRPGRAGRGSAPGSRGGCRPPGFRG